VGKLKILLADDHTILREGLKSLINAQPDLEVVGEAVNGWDAWRKAEELQPDIVIMDISMPELNGAKATERLKQTRPEIKVMALTVHEDRGYMQQLMQAGASGYVLKHAAVDELIHAIRVVAAGGTYLDPVLAGRLMGDLIRRRPRNDVHLPCDLSEREAEVLRLMAWGYSNKEIAIRLNISVRTVETYKVRLMTKLDLQNRVDIVRYALMQGWLQDREQASA
jgi:DNA-binding NarL/FixJ family response regulator